MKRFLIWSLPILIRLVPSTVHAQKIFVADHQSTSDITVYVTDHASRADLIVYRADYPSSAKGNQGLWHFVDHASRADKKIFFTEYTSRADLVIYFTPYRSRAGWRKKSKMHLLY